MVRVSPQREARCGREIKKTIYFSKVYLCVYDTNLRPLTLRARTHTKIKIKKCLPKGNAAGEKFWKVSALVHLLCRVTMHGTFQNLHGK